MSFGYISAFNVPLFLLNAIGMWQHRTSSRSYRIYGLLMHLTFIEFFSFFQTIHVIDLFKNGSTIEVADALTILFTYYSMMIKSCWFIAKVEKIQAMIINTRALLKFSSFGRVGNRPKLKAKIIWISRISNIYYGCSYLAVTVASLVSIIKYKERSLPYDTWLIWDYKKIDGMYWTLQLQQYLMAMYGVSIGCSYDILTVAFLGYISVMLEEVSMEIDSFRFWFGNKRMLEKLEKCIECHIQIKNFTNDVTEHISFLVFVQAIMSCVILCTSAFLLTSVNLNHNLIIYLH